jgi:hypothetical protein
MKGIGPTSDIGSARAKENTGQQEFGARQGQTDMAFSIIKNLLKSSQDLDLPSVF